MTGPLCCCCKETWCHTIHTNMCRIHEGNNFRTLCKHQRAVMAAKAKRESAASTAVESLMGHQACMCASEGQHSGNSKKRGSCQHKCDILMGHHPCMLVCTAGDDSEDPHHTAWRTETRRGTTKPTWQLQHRGIRSRRLVLVSARNR